MTAPRPSRLARGLLVAYLLFWLWMAISPLDRGDWLLENLLAIAFVAALLATGSALVSQSRQ
jgi:putative membrane protein